MTAARLVIAVVVLALSLVPGTSWAHVRSSTGFSEIWEEGGKIRYKLSLEYELLAGTVGLGKQAIAASTNEERQTALAEGKDQIAGYIRPNLRLFLDGAECLGTVERTGVEWRQDIAYANIWITYACPGTPSGTYEMSYGVFLDVGAVVDDHTNVADYVLDGEQGRFVFDRSHRELAVGETGALAAAGRFVVLGVEHILAGLDHVLFIVALLIGASSFASLLKVGAAFTIAHSITLGLAVLGWVHVPAEIVEPLIALSIAYVAAENILGGKSWHRLLVVFGFGLLHGLGFASTLSFIDEINGRLLASLLTFNLGIELGQALIIVALFPALQLVRLYHWSNLAHVGATGVIGVLSLAWFFERLLV